MSDPFVIATASTAGATLFVVAVVLAVIVRKDRQRQREMDRDAELMRQHLQFRTGTYLRRGE